MTLFESHEPATRTPRCFECMEDLSPTNDTGICEDCRRYLCGVCGDMTAFVDCYNCEDGYSHHDCGEDCCPCAWPEDNVPCDICEGKGGWRVCPTCNPRAFDD